MPAREREFERRGDGERERSETERRGVLDLDRLGIEPRGDRVRERLRLWSRAGVGDRESAGMTANRWSSLEGRIPEG